jgi:hypothetical protein
MQMIRTKLAALALLSSIVAAQANEQHWYAIQSYTGAEISIRLDDIDRVHHVAVTCSEVQNNNCARSNIHRLTFTCEGHFRVDDKEPLAVVPPGSAVATFAAIVCNGASNAAAPTPMHWKMLETNMGRVVAVAIEKPTGIVTVCFGVKNNNTCDLDGLKYLAFYCSGPSKGYYFDSLAPLIPPERIPPGSLIATFGEIACGRLSLAGLPGRTGTLSIAAAPPY